MNSRKNTQVRALTQGHWLAGDLWSADMRIQEFLNSGDSSFIQLQNVTISRASEQNPAEEELREVLLPKPMIDLMVILSDAHEAPQKRRNCLVRKTGFDTFVVAAGHTVRGTLHLPLQTTDALRVITTLVDDFFALTDATVTSQSGHRIQAGVVLVHSGCLGGLSIQKAPAQRKSAADYLQTVTEDSGSHLKQPVQTP